MSKIKDIKEWKELFETHILTRGYYYAQEDRVWDIGHEKDVVSAVVAGTEDYLVRNVDEAEWLSFRENILQSEKDTDIRLELLKQEELLDRLMEEVKNRNSIAILDKYERDLRKLYGCEIRDIYADYVRSEMVRASSRNRYNHIIQDLRKIRRYEGGRELASDIAEKWKKEYPRRSAMLDELRKAGF